jgi:hypothetical protein
LPHPNRWAGNCVFCYRAAAFLSAFLLFQVQPMLAKALLPTFGGSYQVWGAAMVFFQGVLLMGYAYGHAVQQQAGVARYARWHIALLLLPLLQYPFRFDGFAGFSGDFPPAWGVFWLLARAALLPCFVLSTSSLVLQRWLAVSALPERRNPYVLYAASNLGSITALLSYPVLVEPWLALPQQGQVWWCGYLVLVLLHLGCRPGRLAAQALHDPPAVARGASDSPLPEGAIRLGRCFLLGAAGCAALLAVTNALTFDVAAAPFLWVLPLTVYLLAFVLAFKSRMWYPAWVRAALHWAAPMGALLFVMAQIRLTLPPVLHILAHLGILGIVCLNCAGALVLGRPREASGLTRFYLALACGGLAGSVVVSWVLPLISTTLVEYPLSLALAVVVVGRRMPCDRTRDWLPAPLFAGAAVLALTVVPWALAGARMAADVRPALLLSALGLPVMLLLRYTASRPLLAAAVLAGVAAGSAWTEQLSIRAGNVQRLRNYYGIYKVYDLDGLRYLQHGTTQHGRQYVDGARAALPLAYYHCTTPAAGVLTSKAWSLVDIGMIGLGAGALVAYTGAGQAVTIYELDPDNRTIAERDFTYLAQARARGARLAFVSGDARVTLRDRAPASLDLLIVDAFSSGAIPVHLLTVEALQAYLRVLRADGILLMHVSNKMLDLVPVVYSNARVLGAPACEQTNAGRVHPDAELTCWMAVTRSDARLARLLGELRWWTRLPAGDCLPRPWTDRYANVLGALLR